jgi:hypothetical protein
MILTHENKQYTLIENNEDFTIGYLDRMDIQHVEVLTICHWTKSARLDLVHLPTFQRIVGHMLAQRERVEQDKAREWKFWHERELEEAAG